MIHPPKRQTRSLPDPFNSRIVNDCELLFIVVIFGANSMWTDIRANRAYSYTSYFAVSQCHRKYIFKVNLIFAHCHVSLPEGTPFRILYLLVAVADQTIQFLWGEISGMFHHDSLTQCWFYPWVASFWWVGCVCVYMFDHIWQCQKLYTYPSPQRRESHVLSPLMFSFQSVYNISTHI